MTETCENIESIICGRCKAQLPPGMTKCPCCGWRSEDIAEKTVKVAIETAGGETEISGDSNICGRCKVQLPPNINKCPCCGWKAPEPDINQEYDINESITCERCKTQLPPGVLTCPCCGWKAMKGKSEPDKPGVFVVVLLVASIAILALLVILKFLR